MDFVAQELNRVEFAAELRERAYEKDFPEDFDDSELSLDESIARLEAATERYIADRNATLADRKAANKAIRKYDMDQQISGSIFRPFRQS